MYSYWSSFRCLSHQGFVGSSRVYCKLLRNYSEVFPPLMWLAKLVQCIECGGDGYFVWILPFFFVCTSLLSSSVFCYLVQVVCLTIPKECSLFGLLKRLASLWFLFEFLSACWVRTNGWMGPSPSSNLTHRLNSVLGYYSSHNYI